MGECVACRGTDLDGGRLLPCLHAMCKLCIDAEGSDFECAYIEADLSCHERVTSKNDLRPIEPPVDASVNNEATLSALRKRIEEVTYNIEGLTVTVEDLRRRGQACNPAIKILSEQRDSLLVRRSRFQAAEAHPSHAAHLLELRLSMELGAKVAPHPERGVDFVYVNGHNQLLFRSQPRNYESMYRKHVYHSGNDRGPGNFCTPSDLVIDSTGNLVIAGAESKCVQIVTQQGVHEPSIPSEGDVHGVALEPNGDIWTVVETSQVGTAVETNQVGTAVETNQIGTAVGTNRVSARKLVLVHPKTAEVKHKIDCPGAECICRLEDGGLVVHCGTRNKVVCFNADGTLRWESEGDGFGTAGGIVVIPGDQVAVCDSNKGRVQILSLHDGQFIRAIGKNIYPRRITFDVVAQVLLVGETGVISAWTLDNTECINRWGHRVVEIVAGMAITEDGTLFVCDAGRRCIHEF